MADDVAVITDIQRIAAAPMSTPMTARWGSSPSPGRLSTPTGGQRPVHGSPRKVNEYLFDDKPPTGPTIAQDPRPPPVRVRDESLAVS
jgi:hypothetical protein